ncbi:MAG TPA: hypothetical protein VF715_13690 [Thermoleophilaceae bacterium]
MRRGAVAALLAAAALAGCGGDSGPSVAWDGQPQVAQHPEIPGDVLVTARVRNESGGELRLDAADVRVVGSDGRPIRAATTFAAGYSHSLYPPRDAPRETPRAESERLGAAATLAPGETAPLTVAWHRPRAGRAVRIEVGGEELPLP